jgi:Domain of unknown function (DUF6946)
MTEKVVSSFAVTRIVIPAESADDWQRLLASPERQWVTGYSARTLAHCWQEADDFPASIKAVFASSPYSLFHDIELLLGIPEHKVPLPGGQRASQTDLFALAKSKGDLVSIAVEGKVSEPFGETARDWLDRRAFDEEKKGRKRRPSDGATARLAYLCDSVGLDESDVGTLRYQLLHRTASALIEAQRFNARHALMLVHSFSPADEWLSDYQAFARALGADGADAGTLSFVGDRSGVDLYLGWTKGEERFLTL